MLGALGNMLGWYDRLGLGSATITIPMVEPTVLFLILTVCLLFRFARTGLLIAFLFVYRWGWAFQEQNLSFSPQMHNLFTSGYIAFGILVFTFAVVAMMYSRYRE